MKRHLLRKWRAAWRDTFLLLREFGMPLVLFSLAIVGGGLLYYSLAAGANEPLSSPAEAVYTILTISFLQPSGAFPKTWYLQIFFFVMPLVAIGILAQGLTDFGVLFFNRRARGKEWEVAVASAFVNHTVLIGLGHLGFRVVKQLRDLNQDVVVIEINPDEELVAQARAMDVPVIHGDASRDSMLDSAGIKRAHVIVLCCQNDNLNMQIAVKARSMNPAIQVVMRIFDDEFAQALQKQFGFTALSATALAAPIFAALSAGMDITPPISVEGQALSLARLSVNPRGKLVGLVLSEIEEKFRVSVVLLRHDSQTELHPPGSRSLTANDLVAVLAGPAQINRLVKANG